MLLKILLKQPVHFLQSLSNISKIEISFIFIMLFAYLSERLYFYIPGWQRHFALSDMQTVYFVSSLHIILFLISAPFILQRLIPRQKQVSVFYSLPLKNRDIAIITAYYFYKYLLIIPLLLSPLSAALIFIYPLLGIYNLSIILYAALIVFPLFLFDTGFEKGKNIYNSAALYGAFFLLISSGRFLLLKVDLPINLVFLILLTPFVYIKYQRHSKTDIGQIFTGETFLSAKGRNPEVNFIIKLPFFSRTTQLLFNKEMLNLWRNPGYRKIKLLSTIIYIASLMIIVITNISAADAAILTASLITVWLHYGNHFSDKYIAPDPDWYFHTLPLNYKSVWLTKFTAEFLYVIILLIIQTLFLIISGIKLETVFSFGALLLLFSVIALAVKLNFQILFYDTPRSAGYAYHFTLLFIVVMCINYRFVGPLISVILLFSYFFKSYRFLKG